MKHLVMGCLVGLILIVIIILVRASEQQAHPCAYTDGAAYVIRSDGGGVYDVYACWDHRAVAAQHDGVPIAP